MRAWRDFFFSSKECTEPRKAVTPRVGFTKLKMRQVGSQQRYWQNFSKGYAIITASVSSQFYPKQPGAIADVTHDSDAKTICKCLKGEQEFWLHFQSIRSFLGLL